MNKVQDIQCRPDAIWSCVAQGDSDRRVARADLQDVQFMDALRALWRDCIEKVRRRAAPEEWEPVETRLAELDRQLVPEFGPRQPN
jgi:hypothetical protein